MSEPRPSPSGPVETGVDYGKAHPWIRYRPRPIRKSLPSLPTAVWSAGSPQSRGQWHPTPTKAISYIDRPWSLRATAIRRENRANTAIRGVLSAFELEDQCSAVVMVMGLAVGGDLVITDPPEHHAILWRVGGTDIAHFGVVSGHRGRGLRMRLTRQDD